MIAKNGYKNLYYGLMKEFKIQKLAFILISEVVVLPYTRIYSSGVLFRQWAMEMLVPPIKKHS